MALPRSTFLLRLLTYWLALALIASGLWVRHEFGTPGFGQILFHLQFGRAGLMDADPTLFHRYALYALALPLLASIALLALEPRLHAAPRYLAALRPSLPVLMLAGSLPFLANELSFWTYLEQQHYGDYFRDHYVPAGRIDAPAHKRNLVLVYVESLESTYDRADLFQRNLLAPLEQATAGWANFRRFEQTEGTGWTMGGIVSSQCGVPLRPHKMKLSGGNGFWVDEHGHHIDGNRLHENATGFLPGVTCLGDILAQAGYRNVFLGGADPEFAGKGMFLVTHGYHEVLGHEDWLRRGETAMNGWGLGDERLLAQAKQRYDQLQQSGQPFNLTLLTLDTHPPHGYPSPSCQQRGARNFPDIVECSAGLVADFVRHVRASDTAGNTDIVVMGDHLSMANDAYAQLSHVRPRYVFNRFYSPRPLPAPNREHIHHFDVLPTVLDMLGFRFGDGRLGLGASGFGPLSPQFKVAEEPHLDLKLGAPSPTYQTFWAAPPAPAR